MDLRIFCEPQQGAAYKDILAAALTAEQSGFSGFFRSDHLLRMGDGPGLPGPTHAWLTLAGLARETSTIRLGTLVSPVTFYQPGILALMAAQVDAMSGGRIELGIGTGWFEREHAAFGLPFPPLGERFARLEEYLFQIQQLWATNEGHGFTHEGTFHSFVDAPGLPKPTQRPAPPIIIGGRGPKRTPKLAAKYAAEYNLPFAPLEEIRQASKRIDEACAEIGRSPAEVVRSATAVLCVGVSEGEVRRRAAAIGRGSHELRANGIAGTTEQAIDRLGLYAEAGIERVYLQVLDLGDLDHIAMTGTDILGAVATL